MMGFFKSVKDKMSNRNNQIGDTQPTAGSDIKHTHNISSGDYKHEEHQQDVFTPPPGPPPNHEVSSSSTSNPPPYESWLAVPDTSQLPPPPALSNEYSSASNASFDAAAAAHRWCAKTRVWTPTTPSNPAILQSSSAGSLGIEPTQCIFKGTATPLDTQTWRITTNKSQTDTTLTSTLPIYFAAVSNPLLSTTTQPPTPNPTTFAYSVTINDLHADGGVAIGFASKPYPPFRLPGWHRASLAVHSDDGNRYVNDPHGGIDFAPPFQAGDTVRLETTFHPRPSPVQVYRGRFRDQKPVAGGLPKCVATCRFSVNGSSVGSWDVHEEKDAERDEGIEGLQGEADLYCAVGVFGKVDIIVKYERSGTDNAG